jgi:hypothetical protein
MELILNKYREMNDSIYNIRLDIGITNKCNIGIEINHNQNIFNKFEQKIGKFCKKLKNKIYTTYQHDNLILYIENDINYVYETKIESMNIIKNMTIIKYRDTILDNIVFPNLERYQNIINHNDNIYKFIIKNINIPIYIHFDKTDKGYNIYMETELNIQQLSYGFDTIEYLTKQFIY